MLHVYKITNLINNKVYIGKTNAKFPNKRWGEHKLQSKGKSKKHFYLHRAMNKYGIENFTFEVIDKSNCPIEILEKEVFYISKYNSYGESGYNLTKGGEGTTGYRHTNETKKMMNENKKLDFLGDKNPFYGKVHDKNTLDKISENTKKAHKEGKYNQSNLNKRKFTAEKEREIVKIIESNQYASFEICNMFNINNNNIFCIKKKYNLNVKSIRKRNPNGKKRIYKSKYEKFHNQIICDYKLGIKISDLVVKYNINRSAINRIICI